MAALVWDQTGDKIFELGDKKVVLYPLSAGVYQTGVAWNGVTGISESPSGGEASDLWADDIKYASIYSTESFGGTIEAYTYPDEFAACDGSAEFGTGQYAGVFAGQQVRQKFGLSYQTTIGNDTESTAYGYKIHIVYGCGVSPSERSFSTINDSPEAITFSWTFTSDPVAISALPNLKPTATIVIDSTKIAAAKLAEIESALYGSASTEPHILTPDDIYDILDAS